MNPTTDTKLLVKLKTMPRTFRPCLALIAMQCLRAVDLDFVLITACQPCPVKCSDDESFVGGYAFCFTQICQSR